MRNNKDFKSILELIYDTVTYISPSVIKCENRDEVLVAIPKERSIIRLYSRCKEPIFNQILTPDGQRPATMIKHEGGTILVSELTSKVVKQFDYILYITYIDGESAYLTSPILDGSTRWFVQYNFNKSKITNMLKITDYGFYRTEKSTKICVKAVNDEASTEYMVESNGRLRKIKAKLLISENFWTF